MQKLKSCNKCKQELPLSNFHKDNRKSNKSGLQYTCISCNKVRLRESELNENGFTSELFNEMFNNQGNVCGLCGTDQPGGPWNKFNGDHDHSTGKARGILCWTCNATLGHLEKKGSEWITKAIKYINKGGL